MIKYLAGIFDSEGYVRIRKVKTSYSIECKVEMTNLEIIELFAERYDLKIKECNRGIDRKLIYRVVLNGKQLRESSFISDLLPHLNEKYYQLDSIRRLLSGENKEVCYQEYMIYKKKFDHQIINQPSFEYLAGIIDGDGCINSINTGNSLYNKYSIGLEQRYKALIEYMSIKFNGSSISKRKIKSVKHNQTYSWQNTTSNSLQLLIGIEPFLVEKKNKCRILINYINEMETFRKFSKSILNEWN